MSEVGHGRRAAASAVAGEHLPPLRVRPLGPAMEDRGGRRATWSSCALPTTVRHDGAERRP